MSTMAMASSSLNPNAPLFIPAAYRQVEDFSPEWWDLVQTTAWFRDHWFRQHQLHEAQHDAALAALPDDLLDTDDLFYSPDHHHQQYQEPSDADAVLRTLNLASPRGAPSPRAATSTSRARKERSRLSLPSVSPAAHAAAAV